jgi:hypothetical protein
MTLVSLGTVPAQASPTYPSEVERELGLKTAPECTLCHASSRGGIGTVTTPFGKSLRELGLGGHGDEDGVARALEQSMDEGRDSDADGLEDVEELLAGSSPNVSGDEPSTTPGATAGSCALRPADSFGHPPWRDLGGFLLTIMAITWFWRHARRGWRLDDRKPHG